MPELLSLSAKKVNVAVEVGVKYPTFGIYLLNDANGDIVQALEMEHQWNVPSEGGPSDLQEGLQPG